MTPPAADSVLEQILHDRYSCRAFLPDEVPADVVRRLFGLAQRTASWCNSQAWQVHLVGGADLERLAKALGDRVLSGPEAPDIAGPAAYEGVYRDRRFACGMALYEAVGVARDDKGGRLVQMLQNFRFFGAPHTAIITAPKALGTYGVMDCGGYVANLLNAAQALGLGAIAQAAIGMYADTVRAELGVPADRDVVCAVSFGYADAGAAVNGFRTERADLSEVVLGLP